MTIKIKILILGVISLIPMSNFAQITIGGGLGYSFPWAVKDIPEGNFNVFNDGTREIEVVKSSLGKGINYFFTLERQLNKTNLFLVCDFSYLEGGEDSLVFQSKDVTESQTYKGRMLWVNPALSFKISSKKISSYLKMGPSIGFFGRVTDNFFGNPYDKEQREINRIYSKGLALGISSSLGVQMMVSKKWQSYLFLEINSLNASYGPKRGRTIKYVIDGIDILSDRPISDKVLIFKDKYIRDPNYSPDEPAILTKVFYPFSSLGLKLGLKFKI